MSLSPAHHEVMELVNTGDLLLAHEPEGIRFYLRDKQITMTGRLIIRPDWNEGPDDRPGLMPVIQKLEDGDTGYCEAGCEPAIEGLSRIYDALRTRLAPSRLFRRQNGRWMLTAHA
ncbi:hypothetical protein GCM10011534_00020 [Pseudooceanicola nanhaiensis]|uniref:Uncharacterized protein n=1 Tax=Pseudooceanicola nanhaiensis TaxID=375761 RepID=A0A917W9P2_9RHOB|nr:hypothetical protein [Pseudooceanicola nanhaiensis]GGL81989.1 hypothetical protein GCM10011534_00020 [Pseudooceanicola nanhaiensis]